MKTTPYISLIILLTSLLLLGAINLNNNTVKINDLGGIYCESINADTVHIRTIPARISAHVTDSGQTTTTNAGQFYFLKGTFHNDNTVAFGFTTDTLYYSNGNYKMIDGLYAFVLQSNKHNTKITLRVYKRSIGGADTYIDGSEIYGLSTNSIPEVLLSMPFMFQIHTNDRIKIMVASDKAGAIITLLRGGTKMNQIY